MSEQHLVPYRLDRARKALAAAGDDFERLRIRDQARAAAAAAAILQRNDIQVAAARLVMEAERAIAFANPPIPPEERSPGPGGANTVPPGNGISRGTLRKLRSVHSPLSDDEFEAACEQAERRGEPITRSTLGRIAARARRARAADHALSA